MGWNVLVIWECELKNVREKRLVRLIKKSEKVDPKTWIVKFWGHSRIQCKLHLLCNEGKFNCGSYMFYCVVNCD